MMKDTRLLIRLKEYVNYASTAESNLAHYITEDPPGRDWKKHP